MDDWQKTVGTREELLEALHRERERREAAERRAEDYKVAADVHGRAFDKLEATLAAVRGKCLQAEAAGPTPEDGRLCDDLLAILDGEGEK